MNGGSQDGPFSDGCMEAAVLFHYPFTMMFRSFYWQVPVAAATGLVAVAQAAQDLDYDDSWSVQDRKAIDGVYRRCEAARSRMLEMIDREELSYWDQVEKDWNRKFSRDGDGALLKNEPSRFSEAVTRSMKRVCVHMMMVPFLQVVEHTAKTGDAKYANKDRFSLLHLALAMGFHDLAKSLVDRGADVNLQVYMQPRFGMDLGGKGDVPLTYTITPFPMFEYLLADDLDSQKKFDATGRIEMVKFLLEHGADANVRLINDLCPLDLAFLWASIQPEYTEIAGLLLDAGAKIEVREGEYEFSALCAAVSFGNLPMVERLVGMGAEVNRSVRFRDGWRCPLVDVNWSRESSPAILKVLLNHGANPDARMITLPQDVEDDMGTDVSASEQTLLMKLCRNLSIATMQEEQEEVERVLVMARILLEKGAAVNAVNPKNGKTALAECFSYLASKDGKTQDAAVRMVRLLLDYGAQVDLLWSDGKPSQWEIKRLKGLPPEVFSRLPELSILKDAVE